MKETFRKLKEKVYDLLNRENFDRSLEKIGQIPAPQVVNPLFSFFHSNDEMIRRRAIMAMGTVVARWADSDLESARVVMRRLMWNLNDESGGIGWSSPEAMGEIMARQEQLAREYHLILISYINEEGNYIEYEPLQKGVLWAVGRLAHVRPHLLSSYAHFLGPYLASPDPYIRGLAAWAATAMDTGPVKSQLERLLEDNSTIEIFIEGEFHERNIGQMAQEAISG